MVTERVDIGIIEQRVRFTRKQIIFHSVTSCWCVQVVLETCYNVLDDLWKLEEFSYPQKRMTHLMDIIAHAITR